MNHDALHEKISRLLDQDLSPEEFAELENTLIHDPEARAYYRQQAQFHSLMALEFDKATNTHPQLNSVVSMDTILERQKWRSLKVSALVAAAVVLISILSLNFFLIPTPSNTLSFETAPASIFTLTKARPNPNKPHDQMEPGDSLKLDQGALSLTFASGVRSIILAPADLTLTTGGHLTLQQGSAWFDVPANATGFTVTTKELKVVDLGTQFGVTSRPKGFDEVHVFKGSVEAHSLRKKNTSLTLNAGNARRLNTVGALVHIPADPSNYLTNLPNALPHVHWNFDENFQAQGSHPIANSIHTQANGTPEITLGKVGAALQLNGSDAFLLSDWNGFAGNRPRTAAFWIKFPKNADFTGHPRGIVGWGDNSIKNAKWKIALTANKKSSSPTLRVSWGDYWIDCPTPLTPDTWHHVLVTSSGSLDTQNRPHADIYLNAKKVRAKPRPIGHQTLPAPNTKTFTRNASPLVIGNDLRSHVSRIPLHATIDELFVFDGYLPPEDASSWLQNLTSH
ncbi:LamG-like jellyroll fold domain-containing protein [Rubritalea tangerina]|uniref:LamG-like jellyroll fold domain-containing protein n=1 Tax=Rubritalea tangerina TaxID=430798 RepID=A0ABW4Z9E8_9BACT